MLVQPISKPTYKKPRKKKYPPLFDQGYCYRCYLLYGIKHTIGLDRHHIYGGDPDRQHSERYGLYVDLCNEFQLDKCHWMVTNEKDKEYINHLKKEGQRRFEAVHGHYKFDEVFRRNYL